MIKQKVFTTNNNNKENDAAISNIEHENQEKQEIFSQQCYEPLFQNEFANTNINVFSKNVNYEKHFTSQNIVLFDDKSNEGSSNESQQSIDVTLPNNGNLSNRRNQLTSNQILNDVRALVNQNLKTEKTLRELLRKINFQKGKRLTQIYNQEDKENTQLIEDLKLLRHHSFTLQNYGENFQSNNFTQTNTNNIHKNFQQSNALNPLSLNCQNISAKSLTQNINNELNLSIYQNNQKEKVLTLDAKQQQNYTKEHQKLQQVKQLSVMKKRDNFINNKVSEKNLLDQQHDKKYNGKQQNQQDYKSQNQSDDNNNNPILDNSKILREDNISFRFARVLINQNYSHDILNYIKQDEIKIVPKNILQNHNISHQLRAKMVDWMIEVMKSYRCSEETFFLAVRLMDQFLEKTKQQYNLHILQFIHFKQKKEPNDIHLIGVTCLFIACKYEEIYPLRLKIIEERIAHKKLTVEQIKATEAEVLNTLNFCLLGTSPYEISMQTLTLIGLQEKLSHQEFSYCHRICLYLSKMVLYDYEYFKSSSYSLLAASVIYIVFKVISQMIEDFIAEQNEINLLSQFTLKCLKKQIKPVIHILKIDSKQLIDSSTKILHLAKNFDQIFPDLKNLKKFNGFEINKQNQSQK